MPDHPFTPETAKTVSIDIAATTANVKIWDGEKPVRTGSIRIYNDGSATAWIDFGGSTITAALATGMPVGSGVTEVVQVNDNGADLYVAGIAAGSTGKIYFTPGEGV